MEEGKQKYEDGDVEAAEALFSKSFEIHPDHIEANYRMAVLLRVLGRTEEAVVLFEKVAKEDSPFKEKSLTSRRIIVTWSSNKNPLTKYLAKKCRTILLSEKGL